MNKKTHEAKKCCSGKIIATVIILDDDSSSSLVKVQLKQSREKELHLFLL